MVPWSESFSNRIFGIDKYTLEKVEFVNQPISNNYISFEYIGQEL